MTVTTTNCQTENIAVVGTKNTTRTDMKPINEYIKESSELYVINTDEFAQDLCDAVEACIEQMSEESRKEATQSVKAVNGTVNNPAVESIIDKALDLLEKDPYNYDINVLNTADAWWYAEDEVCRQLKKQNT